MEGNWDPPVCSFDVFKVCSLRESILFYLNLFIKEKRPDLFVCFPTKMKIARKGKENSNKVYIVNIACRVLGNETDLGQIEKNKVEGKIGLFKRRGKGCKSRVSGWS